MNDTLKRNLWYIAKRSAVSVLALCFLLSPLSLLTSCSSDDGTDKAISYSLTDEPKNLDPQMASDNNSLLVIRNIFEGLTRLDQNGSIIPGVAEEWTSNAESTEFTFHLRKNAVWSDEAHTPVTAKDFVYAWQRALDPATKSAACSALFCIKNARAVNSGEMKRESLGVTVIDDYTLKVSMEYSYPEFVLQTPNAVYMPCNEEFFLSTNGHYGLDDDYIISNGPFIIPARGWSHDNYVRTIRNENYAGYNKVCPRILYFGIRDADTDYYGTLSFGADGMTMTFTKGDLPTAKGEGTFDYYELESYVDEKGEDLSKEAAAEAKIDQAPSLTIFEAGDAVLDFYGQSVDLAFDFEKNVFVAEEKEIPFTLDKEVLSFQDTEGATLSFHLADPGYVGPYSLIALVSEEEGDITEQLELLSSMGLAPTLSIDEEGKGTLDLFGEQTDILFDFEAMTARAEDDDETVMTFTYENGIITFEEEGNSMTFKRVMKPAVSLSELEELFAS